MTSRGRVIDFVVDLTEHETRRLTAVLAAITGGDAGGAEIGSWEPMQVLADETEAHRRLYSDLDPDQRAVYEMLIAEGVLDEAA